MKNESQLKSSKRGVLLRLAIFMALMISAFIIPSSALADFGYTEDSTNYTIDTGANLVFKVKRSNGDISSLIYNGTDYNGYTNKNSHVETGLGQSDVTISQPSSSVIMVKVVYGTLEQYYVARKGENNIYMFTYIADDSVTVTRYIVRLKPSLFPVLNTSNSWYSSYSTLEAKDIFTDTSTGYTYSKHYSDTRVMDYNYTGISNGNVGAYIVRSNHEKASGGPFYRSLIRDNTDVAVNLYEILYYGMAQTDVKRYGLQGPYVLAFTDGGEPSSKLYTGNLIRFLRLKMVELLMLLSRIPQEEGTDLYCSTEQTELAHHLRDHLLTNREGYVSLAQLAEEHGISVSHLQKMFKQVYGVPVYHYIKEYRLEQAAVELVRSAKPITQIAQNAGYDNASKFSEAFRKRYGTTPSQYRTHANGLAKRSREIRME